MGHRFANLIAHDFPAAGAAGKGDTGDDPVAVQYSGKKEQLRPIYDAIIERVSAFGDDVEVSPKKAFVSLRRHKQVATVGPATNGAMEVGLNLKGVAPTARLKAAKGGMASHAARMEDAKEVNRDLYRRRKKPSSCPHSPLTAEEDILGRSTPPSGHRTET